MRRLSSAGPRGRAHFGHPPLHDQDDSVGFARQYCGKLGKQDNCQVAVNLSVASDQASLPIAVRLYLLEAWANDNTRRKKAGVPTEIAFETKPQIALSQIRQAIADGVPKGIVLADAGYGNDTAFRDALTEMGLSYIVGVQSTIAVWAPGTAPLPAQPWSGRGRKTKLSASRRRRQTNKSQRSRRGSPAQGLEDRTLARRDQGPSRLTLCRRAGATIASRLFGGPSPGAKSGCRSSGPRARMHQPSTGSRRCLTPHRSPRSSTQQSCAGALSATSRICNRRSVSITTRVEDGEASTTMRRSRSRPTASCPPNGVRFPPQLQSNTRSRPASRRRSNASSRVVTPLRPKRHTALSITTLRRQLAKRLPRCPCCMRKRAATHASRL